MMIPCPSPHNISYGGRELSPRGGKIMESSPIKRELEHSYFGRSGGKLLRIHPRGCRSSTGSPGWRLKQMHMRQKATYKPSRRSLPVSEMVDESFSWASDAVLALPCAKKLVCLPFWSNVW
jgi:hypothetical protein